MIDMDGLVGLE